MSLLRETSTPSRLEFPWFAFLHIAQTYLLPLRAVFHRPPRLRAMAAALTSPKLDLQRNLKVCALPPSNADLSSVVTHCEPPRRWCLASVYMLGAFSSQLSQ